MSRETIEAKARRYLGEGRLLVQRVEGDLVEATCTGSETYGLGHNDGRGWWCDCPAFGHRCTHLEALMLVVVRKPDGGIS